MTGLLQRLASEARGADIQRGNALIRPASSVHAQPPAAMPLEIEDTPSSVPRTTNATINESGSPLPAAQSASRPSVDMQSAPARVPFESQRPAPWMDQHNATQLEPRVVHKEAPAGGQSRGASSEGRATVPRPLLEEVEAEAAPQAVSTVAVSPVQTTARITQPASQAEPTEVHVHIGRIEVIAATEPTAPRKSRTPPRNTLSLSDYLARRRRS